ncbi:MAG: tetratricopeptide repeat protein, partial [Thermoguttaceae bacterium]
HIDVATTLNNLAVLSASTGDHDWAKALYKRCLTILERALGKNHPQTKACRQNYANLPKV